MGTTEGLRGLRVLHLIDSGGLYGAERMLLALVTEQRKQGLAPMILSAGDPGLPEKPLETEARRLGLPITPWRMRPGLNLKAARRIAHWARDAGYRILHSHGYKFSILLALLPRSARGENSVLISTQHGYVTAPFATKLWVYQKLDRLALLRVDAVVIVNEDMRRLMPRAIRDTGRCVFIPNGIDPTAPAPRPLPPKIADFVGRHRVNLVAVGRLSPEKGLADLIRAVAQYRAALQQVGFVLLGEGRLRPELERMIAEQRLETQFLMPGYLDDVAGHLGHFDALVMPSLTEGLPITVLEALRAKCPIIATRVGGLPAVLADCPSATLVPPATPSLLAAAIAQQAQAPLDASAVVASRALFMDRYAAAGMASRYLDQYQYHLRPRVRDAQKWNPQP